MKLLIRDTSIIGTATDAYAGPEHFVTAPDGFEPLALDAWVYVDGKLQPVVPQTVSRFQGLAALHIAGLLEQVEAIIANPATDPIVRLAWSNVQEFHRQSPMVATFATELEWTDDQIDDLFIMASGIEA